MTNYHNPLAKWMQGYILHAVRDVNDDILWKRIEGHNSCGWVLMHLIAEAELAMLTIDPNYQMLLKDSEAFQMGADGNGRSEWTIEQIKENFQKVYQHYVKMVNDSMEDLHQKPIQDESLSKLLDTQLNFHLHLLTTHLTMHAVSLMDWRKAMELD